MNGNLNSEGQTTLELELGDVEQLVNFSAAVTSTLQLADGRYCFDRTWSSPHLRGESSRYSLMVGLGFERAARAGYELSRSAADILDAVMARPETLTTGDRGLALWLACRLLDDRAESLLGELSVEALESQDHLEGMEIAWMLLGAAEALGAGYSEAEATLAHVVRMLRSRLTRKSPLVRHLGGGWRSRYPNFATQIYSVLALAEVARVWSDEQALRDACALADFLIEARRLDHGWPWLYDTDSGTVVEPYELYSVHQDAMAPMALFALAEVTGDDGYAVAGAEGAAWCYGRNEMEFNFYDVANRFAHRSIRRTPPMDRAVLIANTAASRVGLKYRIENQQIGVAVDDTCRPYHLGWIMEAWSGREHRALDS